MPPGTRKTVETQRTDVPSNTELIFLRWLRNGRHVRQRRLYWGKKLNDAENAETVGVEDNERLNSEAMAWWAKTQGKGEEVTWKPEGEACLSRKRDCKTPGGRKEPGSPRKVGQRVTKAGWQSVGEGWSGHPPLMEVSGHIHHYPMGAELGKCTQ